MACYPCVSIRCREGRTAERWTRRTSTTTAQVSIRCREGRTAEQPGPGTHTLGAVRFYSLSRGAYSGTGGLDARQAIVAVFLFAVARGVQRNPTLSGEAVTSTNDVRFHTRRPEPFSEGVRRPLGRAFVLVRGLHTRGPPERSSRQPPVLQATAHPGPAPTRVHGHPDLSPGQTAGRSGGGRHTEVRRVAPARGVRRRLAAG